jgi:hypothetical protein
VVKTAVGAPEEGRVICQPLIVDPREKQNKKSKEMKMNEQILYQNLESSIPPSYESTIDRKDSHLGNLEVSKAVEKVMDLDNRITYDSLPPSEWKPSRIDKFCSISVSVPVTNPHIDPGVSKIKSPQFFAASALLLAVLLFDKVKKYFSGKNT